MEGTDGMNGGMEGRDTCISKGMGETGYDMIEWEVADERKR
jgi:hypothetical protein